MNTPLTPHPTRRTRADGESIHKSLGGPQRLINALRYSFHGLSEAIRVEAAFRQELILVVVLTPVSIWFDFSAVERVLLIGVLLLLLAVELLNSALEAVVDRISLDNHDLSRRAKDFGSAAVFVMLALVALTWTSIALPVLWRAWGGAA